MEVERVLAALSDCEVHGELVGTRYWLFDVLALDGENLRPLGYRCRLEKLETFLRGKFASCVSVVDTAWSEHGKRELFFRLQADNREGVVFKNIHAPSTPGRPASGGSQVKRKFLSTATFKVQAVNQKRSVRLCLLDDNDAVVSMGNCTIPPNKDVPQEGNLVEVEYLYAHVGGSVVQPTYIGERDDIQWPECRTSQLKYKPEDEEGNES